MRSKIFVFTLESPCIPGSGGEVRTYHFIKMLAQHYDVTLVSLGGPQANRKVGKDIADLCRRVIEPETVSRTSSVRRLSRIQAWLRTLSVILTPWRNDWKDFNNFCMQYLHGEAVANRSSLKPTRKALQFVLKTQYRLGTRFSILPTLSVFQYSSKFDAIKEQAFKALAGESFDILWYEQTSAYPFVKTLLSSAGKGKYLPLVCNSSNIEWVLYDRLSRMAEDPWGAESYRLESRLAKKIEAEQFHACSMVITCSEEDKQLGRNLAPEAKFVVVGNGVDTTYFRPSVKDLRTDLPTLLFTGTFGYGPNRDAVKYFLENIFPLINAKKPDCHFLFAGFNAQDTFDALGIDDDRISCVSSPPDIRPLFDKAWVFVVPLRSGGGTRLKIFEAMSMKCPIVSTKIGAEGIPAVDGQHFLLADTPTDFANQVLELIDDRALRLKLAKEASVWVHEYYDWNVLCGKALRSLRECLGEVVAG